MIHIEDMIDKLKILENTTSTAQIARVLHLKPDAFFQRQQRNSIPHDNVIKYCLENKISIDMLYSNVNATKIPETGINNSSNYGIENIKVYDSDEYISIPLEKAKNRKLTASIDTDNKTIYIVNTEENQITDGLYFVKNNGKNTIKNFQATFSGTFIVSEPTTSVNFEATKDDLKKIDLIGKVVHKILY